MWDSGTHTSQWEQWQERMCLCVVSSCLSISLIKRLVWTFVHSWNIYSDSIQKSIHIQWSSRDIGSTKPHELFLVFFTFFALLWSCDFIIFSINTLSCLTVVSEPLIIKSGGRSGIVWQKKPSYWLCSLGFFE